MQLTPATAVADDAALSPDAKALMAIGKRDTPFLSRHMLVDMDALLDGLFKKPLTGSTLHLICTVRLEGQSVTHALKPRKGVCQLLEVVTDKVWH
jgi:hypothetical protein